MAMKRFRFSLGGMRGSIDEIAMPAARQAAIAVGRWRGSWHWPNAMATRGRQRRLDLPGPARAARAGAAVVGQCRSGRAGRRQCMRVAVRSVRGSGCRGKVSAYGRAAILATSQRAIDAATAASAPRRRPS